MRQFFPKTKILLLLIILLGLVLRFYKFEQRFNFDAELNTKAWTIENLVIGHKFPLVGIEAVSYLHHLFYPPLFQYLGGILFFFSNLDPLSIEIALILLFIPSAFLIYKISIKLFNEKIGMIACLIYSFSFFVNTASRFIWVVGPMLIISLSIFYTIQTIANNKKDGYRQILILGTLIAIAFNFHFQTGIIFISTIIWFLMYKSKSFSLKTVFVFLIPIIIAFLPLAVFDLRHNFFNLKGIFLFFSQNKSNSFFTNLIFANLTFAQTFLSILSESFALQLKNSVLALSINLSIIFLPMYLAKKINSNEKRASLYFIFINFLLSYVFFPFLQNRFYSSQYYLFFLLPYFVIIFAFTLMSILKSFKIFIIILLLLFMGFNLKQYVIFKILPNYHTKILALSKIVKENQKNKKLTIYSSNLAS